MAEVTAATQSPGCPQLLSSPFVNFLSLLVTFLESKRQTMLPCSTKYCPAYHFESFDLVFGNTELKQPVLEKNKKAKSNAIAQDNEA